MYAIRSYYAGIAPVMKGEFSVEKPKNWQSADALYLTATDPHGMELFTWSYPVKTSKQIKNEKISYNSEGSLNTQTSDQYFLATAGDIQYKFDKKTGLLKEVSKEGKLIPLTDGPVILRNNFV